MPGCGCGCSRGGRCRRLRAGRKFTILPPRRRRQRRIADRTVVACPGGKGRNMLGSILLLDPVDRLLQQNGLVARLRVGRGRVVAGAVAVRRAAAQEEHGQFLVVPPPLTDLLALVEDGRCDAIQRTADCHVAEPVDRLRQRRIPGLGEAGRIRAVTQGIGRARRHPDRSACLHHTGRRGERADKGVLSRGRPAVVAWPDGYGIERRGRLGPGLLLAHRRA